MTVYKLRDLDDFTVGHEEDFENFEEVINWVFKTRSYERALKMLDMTGIEDLSEAVTNDKGYFDEGLARDLCLDVFDGVEVDQEDEEFKLEWEDHMLDRALEK